MFDWHIIVYFIYHHLAIFIVVFLTEFTSPYSLNTQRRWHTSKSKGNKSFFFNETQQILHLWLAAVASVFACELLLPQILTLWRRNYFFFNFSTLCMWNVNNTGTKQFSIMKQTPFWREKNGEYRVCLKYSGPIFVEWIYKMQRLEVSVAVRPIYGSLGVKRLSYTSYCAETGGKCSVTNTIFGYTKFLPSSGFEKKNVPF